MLKKEGPSGEAATQQWHSSGVSVGGGRVSPVFPPYLEAGVILLQDKKEMWDVLGRLLCGPPGAGLSCLPWLLGKGSGSVYTSLALIS